MRNQYTQVAIENLYKNKLHDRKYGMLVYDGYKSVSRNLFTLFEEGLINLRMKGAESALDNSDPNYKGIFDDTCGFIDNRKQRTSNRKNKHVIELNLNEEIFSENAIHNKASKKEIQLLAEHYHMCHQDMQEKTLNLFIEKKNTLMKLFGKAGLDIYRVALEKYFKEKHEHIVYYDLSDKAVNHFTDFYLLEEIKKVILGAIRSDLGNKGAITEVGYPFTKTHVPNLVQYFVSNSSDEHKVLIDQDIQLIDQAHKLMSRLSLDFEEHWACLQDSIETY